MLNVETIDPSMFSDSLFCNNSINNSSNRRDNHENRRDSYAIFRYKFTQEFMDQLYQFSKIHQYDDRKSFKEAWLQWVIDNEELVGSEVTRLADLGYKGDIIDKMFKSGRYYF
jgi:hypothetical protein